MDDDNPALLITHLHVHAEPDAPTCGGESEIRTLQFTFNRALDPLEAEAVLALMTGRRTATSGRAAVQVTAQPDGDEVGLTPVRFDAILDVFDELTQVLDEVGPEVTRRRQRGEEIRGVVAEQLEMARHRLRGTLAQEV